MCSGVVNSSESKTVWRIDCFQRVSAVVHPQIRDQMCLETNFQYYFSLLGRFGQSGLQRKKVQTAIGMPLLRLWLVFYVFMEKQ